jgi:hypothetical protein
VSSGQVLGTRGDILQYGSAKWSYCNAGVQHGPIAIQCIARRPECIWVEITFSNAGVHRLYQSEWMISNSNLECYAWTRFGYTVHCNIWKRRLLLACIMIWNIVYRLYVTKECSETKTWNLECWTTQWFLRNAKIDGYVQISLSGVLKFTDFLCGCCDLENWLSCQQKTCSTYMNVKSSRQQNRHRLNT